MSSHVKQWWDGLSDEDKTLAMQIDFTSGENFDEQLKELKEKAEIDDIYARTAEATGWSEEAIRSYADSL
jgi:protease II